MKRPKIFASILIVVMCCGLLVCLAACPPMPEYEGVAVGGLTAVDDYGLILKSVDYKLNIVDYPSRSAFTDTGSSASVTYVIGNGSLESATVPLYLVVDQPSVDYYDYDFDIVKHYKQYRFETNAICDTVLHCVNHRELSFAYNSNSVDKVQRYLDSLHDEKQTDDYYNGDLLIYKYTYAVTDVSAPDAVSVLLYESDTLQYQKIFFDRSYWYRSSAYSDGYDYYVDLTEYDNNTVTFYSVGMELTDIEQHVKFCDGAENEIENGGKLTAVSNEVVTFDELAMTYYDAESLIPEVDWYNAVLAEVGNLYEFRMHTLDVFDNVCYAYQCNLAVPAQGEVSLTVTMPLYPSINYVGYTDDVYEYEMDFSSVLNWQGAPNVTVEVVTDGYLLDSSLDFKKTSTGYELSKYDGVSQSVTLTLSNDRNVESVAEANAKATRRVIAIVVGLVLLCCAVPITIVAIVVSRDNAKRKMERAEKTDDTSTTI